ncbi:SGNH/GDSL hydrolase family protein [Flavobacteriaceae bacterium]|nr:SGNH/GDSL hydrolase family protein [Flavobacteriaceae bacterium]
MKRILFTMTMFAFGLVAYSQNNIALTDANIFTTGANYKKANEKELILHRHAKEIYDGNTQELLFNPLKARSGSGIVLKLKTKSPRVKLKVVVQKGGKGQAIFGIRENGIQLANVRLKSTVDLEQTIVLKNTSKGSCSTFQISLPLWLDVHVTGIELEDNYSLEKIKKETKGVYIAYGDSITHGRGQDITEETYAYKLAESLNMELFNIAVGGGKASNVTAKMIANDFENIDLITVLIGYNDLVGNGISLEVFHKRYKDVLETIRIKHKKTKIVCITLLTTKTLKSKKSGHKPEEFREVIKTIVNAKIAQGDKKLVLVEGPSYSSLAGLNDAVHLNKSGAVVLAKALANELE